LQVASKAEHVLRRNSVDIFRVTFILINLAICVSLPDTNRLTDWFIIIAAADSSRIFINLVDFSSTEIDAAWHVRPSDGPILLCIQLDFVRLSLPRTSYHAYAWLDQKVIRRHVASIHSFYRAMH